MKFTMTATALAFFAAGLAMAAADEAAPAALLVTPSALAMDDALAGGCWARLYKDRDYAGTALTLTGPLSIPSIDSSAIAANEIGRAYESVVVGPAATLTVWAQEDYEDDGAVFEAGQKIPALRRVKSYFDEFKSMKLSCRA